MNLFVFGKNRMKNISAEDYENKTREQQKVKVEEQTGLILLYMFMLSRGIKVVWSVDQRS